MKTRAADGRRRVIRALIACALAALLPVHSAQAAAGGEARFNVEVAAGQWRGLRVKNLPKGTNLAVEARASGALRILLLDEEDVRRMPVPANPLFEGALQERLSFSLEIPRGGNYYVVLDNRAQADGRKVQLVVRARAPGTPAPPPGKRAARGISVAARRTPATA